MSVLRTVRCPACGKTRLANDSCPCGGRAAPRRRTVARAGGVLLVFALTGGGVTLVSLALAEAKGMGYGIAAAFGAWLLVWLCRMGYDHDDGIDVWQRLFPSPFDWPVKIESLVNFWTAPRPYFRAAYLGAAGAFIAVMIVLVGRGA